MSERENNLLRAEQLIVLFRHLTKKAELPQATMAKMLEVSQPTISLWLSGKSLPSRGDNLRMLEWACKTLAKALKEKRLPLAQSAFSTRAAWRKAVERELGFIHPAERDGVL